MKYSNSIAKAATFTTAFKTINAGKVSFLTESYSGPGRVECFEGTCDFVVDASLGCDDPCHTYTISNPFEYSFSDVGVVSGKIRQYPSREICYYNKAEYIDTEDWFDHWGLKIDEGCIATCTGCTFYPTETFAGPGSLQCREGDCYNYSDQAPYNDCGTQIQDASEEWGELSLLGQGSDDALVFQGFNNITTTGTVMIGEECTLDCSGCEFKKLRKINWRGAHRRKKKAKTLHYSNDG